MNYEARKKLGEDVKLIMTPLSGIIAEISDIEYEMSKPGFWDRENAAIIAKKYGELEMRRDNLIDIQDQYDYIELLEDEMNCSGYVDDSFEWDSECDALSWRIYELMNDRLFQGEYDDSTAIITFHAGSGGDEACDFTDMMVRAVARWAESQYFKVEVIDKVVGDVAGFSSLTMMVTGDYESHPYGYAKALHGVYRLVRVSPFDAAGRRHTSFMSIEVMPMTQAGEVRIDPNDIEMETMIAHVHAGGQSAQHNNTGVRLIHKPTGIAVRYDVERSQMQNRMGAMRILESKLGEIERQKHAQKMDELRGEQKDNGWGNAAVSITLMPYQLVQDRRTGWESGNTTAFLDGEMQGMIDKWLEVQYNG